MLDHIGQIPAHAARNFQDREALVFEGVSYSFNELNTLIEKTAGALHGLGLGEGDVVTLYASNSWQWVVSYFAIARIGAVIVPQEPWTIENGMLTPTLKLKRDQIEAKFGERAQQLAHESAEKRSLLIDWM